MTTTTTLDRPVRRHRPARAASMGYRPALDGVRAIAVVAVVLFHFEFAWIPGGSSGWRSSSW